MTSLPIILSLIIGAIIVIACGLCQGGRYTPKDPGYKDPDE